MIGCEIKKLVSANNNSKNNNNNNNVGGHWGPITGSKNTLIDYIFSGH